MDTTTMYGCRRAKTDGGGMGGGTGKANVPRQTMPAGDSLPVADTTEQHPHHLLRGECEMVSNRPCRSHLM